MKSETLKNALNAHGWVGLIISLPLFIVFWAGAMTLFHPEMMQWAQLPNYTIDVNAKEKQQQVSYNELIERQIQEYNILPDARISLQIPTEKSPYLRIGFRVPIDTSVEQTQPESQSESNKEPEKIKTENKNLLIDPYTGEVFTDHNQFGLANFLYELHQNLNIPQGSYIVGVITLFFLVIIITGVVVQLKNIIKHFFLYRKDQTTRSTMNDMHNVIGVISLPYAAMYAITGIILNLLILVQIPSVFLLYDGDLNAISKDAGFYNFQGEASGEAAPMPVLENFILEHDRQYNAKATRLTAYNYGDKNAVIQIRGGYRDGFNKQFTHFYEVSTDSYPTEMNISEDNVFSTGLLMLYSMHFANYAGTDMRLLYFILAMAFCGMIVAGNVLWIVKRQKKNDYPKTLTFTRGATLGACLGVITATAFSILLERVLPEGVIEREHLIEYAFGTVLLIITCLGFFAKRLRPFIGFNFIASGVLLVITLAYESAVLGGTIIALGNAGYQSIWYFSAGLFVISMLFLWIGSKIIRDSKPVTVVGLEAISISGEV